MAGSYYGIPNSSLSPGVNVVQTGSAGPTRASDYNYSISFDGTTPITDPNTIIPAGATLYVFNPGGSVGGSGSGQQVVTGTQIPLDAAAIWDTYEGRRLEERGQDQAMQIAMAQFAQAGAIADRQYQTDVARLGIEQADLMYRQRLSQAQLALQKATYGLDRAGMQLSQNQFNASQRQTKAKMETDILQMLVDRTGPQDWVAYNRLVNGLNAPNPQSSTTIDPFARLKDLYVESNIAFPDAPDLAFEPVAAPQASQAPAPLPGWPAASGGGPAPALPQAAPSAPPATMDLTNDQQGGDLAGSHIGVPLDKVNKGWNYLTTGAGGDFSVNDLDPSVKIFNADRTPFAGSTVKASTPYWFNRAARGGDLADVPLVVGDNEAGTNKPSKRMTGHEEMVINLNPEPDDLMMVVPHRQTKAMLGKQPVRRAAGGGTYGSGLNDNTVTINSYGADVIGNLPIVKKAKGAKGREFGGFGATLSNPKLGLYDMPNQISYQTLRDLLPSETDMLSDLYGRGLTYDPRDLFESARRAAPFGRSNGPAFYSN